MIWLFERTGVFNLGLVLTTITLALKITGNCHSLYLQFIDSSCLNKVLKPQLKCFICITVNFEI